MRPCRLIGKLVGLALSLAFVATPALDLIAGRRPPQPNILLIMADDLGFSDIGCYGGEIHTPNLDRLAEEGLRFRRFYNCSLCGPSRASLMTGLYSQQTGVRGWTGTMHQDVVTIPELLKKAGYTTLLVGRMDMVTSGTWHDPRIAGECLDRFFGSNGHTGPGHYFQEVKGCQFFLDGEPYRVPPEGFYATDALTDQAVRFIKEAATRDAPFFLYAAYNAPHWPLHAREEDIATYRETYKKLGWDRCRKDRYRRLVKLGLLDKNSALSARDHRVPTWEAATNKEWQAERMAVYAAQVDVLDRNIGRLLAAIEEAGVEENTLVLFLSDNGASHQGGPKGWFETENWRLDGQPVRFGNDPSIWPGPPDTFSSYGPEWACVSNTPFRLYKGTPYEGGIITPLLVRWPAVIRRGGQVTDQVGHVMDVMATVLDVAGVTYPRRFKNRPVQPLEGRSLLPAFQGKKRDGHKALFWEQSGHRAVRVRDWKLVALRGKPWELYDLKDDPTETKNLADQENQKVKEMEALFERWEKRCGRE